MQLVSCHAGRLHTVSTESLGMSPATGGKAFRTGLVALDALAPRQGFARGAVHELLMPVALGRPMFAALVLAKSAARRNEDLGQNKHQTSNKRIRVQGSMFDVQRSTFAPSRPIIWCDPAAEFYPPAAAAAGVSLNNLYLLHPKTIADQSWAVAECLRCPGVAAVVVAARGLSRIEARRLQLAAERGGGVGIVMRPAGNGSDQYAAATRWLVTPAPGQRTAQRWKMQLIHGHGGRVGQAVFLEYSRETNSVRAIEQLPDRSDESRPAERAIA